MNQQERIARARAALAHAELRTGARSLARPSDGGPSGALAVQGTAALAVLAPAGEPAPAGETVPAGEQARAGVPAGGGTLLRGDALPGGDALLRRDALLRGGALPGGGGPSEGAGRTGGAVPSEGVLRTSGAVPSAGAASRVAGGRAATPAGPVAVPDLPGLPGVPGSDRPAAPSRTPARGPVLLTDRPPLAVPPALTPLLPDGLRRGSTTAVLGSTSLVLAMVAAACTAREAWAAVVGQPSLGLLAAAQTGVALERLAVVPRPGVDAPTVVAALLDGIDVVVVGPGATLADADRRRLMARARDRGSVLLSTAPWPGAGCVLTVEGGRWSGVGDGDGRLRAHELHVTRTGRGSAGQAQDLRVTLPLEVGTDPYGLPAAPAVPDRTDRPDLRLVG